eukprot:365604-Chlamydomonas_euryale.AAC.5
MLSAPAIRVSTQQGMAGCRQVSTHDKLTGIKKYGQNAFKMCASCCSAQLWQAQACTCRACMRTSTREDCTHGHAPLHAPGAEDPSAMGQVVRDTVAQRPPSPKPHAFPVSASRALPACAATVSRSDEGLCERLTLSLLLRSYRFSVGPPGQDRFPRLFRFRQLPQTFAQGALDAGGPRVGAARSHAKQSWYDGVRARSLQGIHTPHCLSPTGRVSPVGLSLSVSHRLRTQPIHAR